MILIVEDDPHIRFTLQCLLELEGYSVAVASDGREAMRLLETTGVRPALILLDLLMPVVNGWDFLAKQSQIPELRSIPILVLSAVGADKQKLPEQVRGIHPKPIDLNGLLDAIRTSLSA